MDDTPAVTELPHGGYGGFQWYSSSWKTTWPSLVRRLVGPSESANFVAHVGIHGMLFQEVGLASKELH